MSPVSPKASLQEPRSALRGGRMGSKLVLSADGSKLSVTKRAPGFSPRDSIWLGSRGERRERKDHQGLGMGEFWSQWVCEGQQEGAELHLHRGSANSGSASVPSATPRSPPSSTGAHQSVPAALCLPLHLSALHTGAVIEMRTSPQLYKPRGPFKNLSQGRNDSTPSQKCTRGCFDKLIVSTAQVDGGFWKKSRDFLLQLTSPTQTPPFCSKQKCYFPSLSLPFFFFPEGIKIQDRKEHK